MGSLSGEFSADGKLDVFNRIKGYLTGDGDLKYAELGAGPNLSEPGTNDLLREEVHSTVPGLSEVDDELPFLLRAIRTQSQEVR